MKNIVAFEDFLQLREDFKNSEDIFNFLVEEYTDSFEVEIDEAEELLNIVENFDEDEFEEYYKSLDEDEQTEFDELILEEDEAEITRKFNQIKRRKERQVARTPDQKKQLQTRLAGLGKARKGREAREIKTAVHQGKRRTGLRGAFRKAKLKTSVTSKKLGLTKFEPAVGKAAGKNRLTKRGAFVAGAATVGGLAIANRIRKARKNKGEDFSTESYAWIGEDILTELRNISENLFLKIYS